MGMAQSVIVGRSAALSILWATLSPGLVQEATPAAAILSVPPAACTVEPRPQADFERVQALTPVPFVNLQGTPAATPSPPSGGVPADASLQKAITDTVIAYGACTNARDMGRFAALMTDDLFQRFFAGTSAEQLAVMANTPPAPEDERASFDAITDIQLLPDGRVTARVVNADGYSLVVFKQVGDHWLIDYLYNFPRTGTPTP